MKAARFSQKNAFPESGAFSSKERVSMKAARFSQKNAFLKAARFSQKNAFR